MRPGLVPWLSRSMAVLAAATFLVVQPAGPASAQQLSPQQVSEFLANPSALLTANPDGGEQLASAIRDLVLADPATLPVIIALLANANTAQQASIGSGLGQAALAVAQSNPTLATQIQEAVAASGVQTAIASFSTTTGNTVTAATGTGGGGLGGPTGSSLPTGGGGGDGGGGGGTGAGGGGGGLTGGGGGVGGGGGGGTPGGVSGSVSPS